jgi:hypothetical protein
MLDIGTWMRNWNLDPGIDEEGKLEENKTSGRRDEG